MVLIWAALGWLLGIGLNAIAHELPRSHRLLARPCCVECGVPLPWTAFSILQRGARSACPACQTRVLDLARTLEWPTAIVFGGLAWCLGLGLPLGVYSAYALILLLVLVIDLRHRWVYSIVCYPGILLGVVLTGLIRGTWWPGLLGALIGAALFFFLYWLGRLLYRGREAMGVGDISIAALIGSMVGPDRVLAALFLGGLVVAAVSVVLLVSRRASAGDFIPYGAGLCLGALATLLLGCPAQG